MAAKSNKADAAAGAPAPVAAVVPAPAPAAAPVEKAKAVPSLAAEIANLEARIASDQARLAELHRKRDFQEFPKMVKGQLFHSRAAQDAAGPDFADS